MTNNRHISKDVQQIAFLSFLLLIQILVLTKLVQYDRIKREIGVRNDDGINVSQPSLDETTSLASDEISDFVLGDLNDNGIVDNDDLQLIQEYAMHPESLPENLFDAANINGDDYFDVRDVSAFRRKFDIGE